MKKKNDLEETDIKNRASYYLDGIFNIDDLDLDNGLSDKKSYESISIYHVAYKAPFGEKPRWIT